MTMKAQFLSRYVYKHQWEEARALAREIVSDYHKQETAH